MLSLKPMITFGEPGKVTPYTFTVGELSCISYQMDGKLNSRCGSLHRIGAPLLVFVPFTAQLLLPLFGLGFSVSTMLNESFFPKYKESALAGFMGIIPGGSNTVPFGTIGTNESCTSGYRYLKSSNGIAGN